MLSWILNIIFIILFIIIYLHIYLHFRVSNINEFIRLNDICRKEITDTIYYKQPFYFDGTSIKHKVILNDNLKTCNKGYDLFKQVYESLPLLEPSVRFFPSSVIYHFHKKHKFSEVETNLECRNFYYIHKGKVKIYCIHPKYSEHFFNKHIENDNKVMIDFIKNNENMIHVELDENMVLFVPNYWYVLIESIEKDCCVEKIQYKTILNHFNFIYDNYANIILL